MTNTTLDLQKSLDSIAAKLPMVEKTDLSILVGINTELERIEKEFAIAPAFKTMLARTRALITNMIMGDTSFEEGLKKLNESISKMQKSIGKTTPGPMVPPEATETTPLKKEPQSDTTIDSQDDLSDLLIKFATCQKDVLEDFEAFSLEFEKGDPAAKPALKRILHTWKGEFGVLDLQEYSKLIHNIEENLENDTCSAETLLRLKDMIAGKCEQFASGRRVSLTADEASMAAAKTSDAPIKADPKPSEAKAPENSPSQTGATDNKGEPSPDQAAFTGDLSLLGDFVTESRDHILSAETLLLELETTPDNSEFIDSIFRAWHTIKGIAGFLGLKQINELAHSMESLMDRARKKEILLNAGSIDLFLEGNDCLKEYIASVEKALAGSILMTPHNFMTVRKKLSSPLPDATTPPATDPAISGKMVGEILVESGAAAPEVVQNAIDRQQNGDGRKLGQILVEDGNVPARQVGTALAAQQAGRQASTVIEETIRVPISRIDQLVDSIGEAVIAQSMIYATQAIRDLGDQTISTKITHAGMIMRQIQEMAMSLRMVSIKSTFQKMARLAHDLSKKSGKDVEFLTDGEDTELDKSVVEKIGDPLIHMIRNSIDHGIESPADRAKAGKPAKAIAKLRAYHRAGSIFIEVIDDGKGLDKEAILQKAISRGLCKEGEKLLDQEIYQFIFLPGFSTAKQVTDVSGRGVGMDVVRRNIESLRGSIEIFTEIGKGTTFTIRLPLTLAIVDGMIIRSGDETYIVPTLAILESLTPAKDQIDTIMGREKIVKVRGELIPLIELDSILKRSGTASRNRDFVGVVMIVEDMLGKRVGLHVDEILGQQQVVIKSLGDSMGDIPGVTGGAIMSDGKVSLILDVGGIVKIAEG